MHPECQVLKILMNGDTIFPISQVILTPLAHTVQPLEAFNSSIDFRNSKVFRSHYV
jgi:hypothetical protein